jgi:hypothetical protein
MADENKPEDQTILSNQTGGDFKKIINWSFEHDELLSNWGDHAACYTWMHDITQRKFSRINMFLGVPVIILSTVSGTANFGISTIFPAGFNYGNAIIGTLSLITGVISTVANFLGYAQAEEAHRISAIQWSKFKRTIETELSLKPNERQSPSEFIKHARAELDRLMEQSPIIPQDVISKFIKTFRKVKNVKMPEICNKLEPTTIYSELFDLHQSALQNKNIDATVISASDKSVIKSVRDKITSFFTSSPKPNINPINNDSETENDAVITINEDQELNKLEENKNIINYSNTIPVVQVNEEEKPVSLVVYDNIKENPEEKPEQKLEEKPEQKAEEKAEEKAKVKTRITGKQLIYGKK